MTHHILVRAPTWVGDAVMATPALRALRAAHPDARIRLEGHAALAGLFDGLDSFDEFGVDPGRGSNLWRRTRELRRGAFDLAVLLPDSPRAALAPFLARIPRRVGYARDPLRRLLVTQPLAHPQAEGRRIPIPTIERYLRITRALGCEDRGDHPELVVSFDAANRITTELAGHGISESDEILVVTPGASFGSSKLWPPEHFAQACDRISREVGLVPVLCPGPGEQTAAERIASGMTERAILLTGAVPTLAALKALVARARLVLSNDTGPRHIAVALDRPVVVLMGPTNPVHSAMHLDQQRVLRHDVDCSPCQLKVCPIDHRCMTGLLPARAVDAARELLAA